MLLTGGKLTVALVSTHLPLVDAVQQLSSGEIVRGGVPARRLSERQARAEGQRRGRRTEPARG